jgi:hypothetical protein
MNTFNPRRRFRVSYFDFEGLLRAIEVNAVSRRAAYNTFNKENMGTFYCVSLY